MAADRASALQGPARFLLHSGREAEIGAIVRAGDSGGAGVAAPRADSGLGSQCRSPVDVGLLVNAGLYDATVLVEVPQQAQKKTLASYCLGNQNTCSLGIDLFCPSSQPWSNKCRSSIM